MAEQPSLGGAIALQGRNTIAEQLGKMQVQMGQKEADRLAKQGLLEAKKNQELMEKFVIPKGNWHRLVLPEVEKKQVEYTRKATELKSQRPNNWQNDLNNLANQYTIEMQSLSTLSKDFSDYDTRTASIDKGNTYFSNEWKKYNTAFENAKDVNDFEKRLADSGFDPSKAGDFIVRPNKSISYTPFSNQKPLETIAAEVRKVPVIEYKEVTRPGAFGSVVTKKVQRRPATVAEAQEILKNNSDLFKDANEIETIEDVVVSYLTSNPYGAVQYADENNLNLRRNPDGTFVTEDFINVKNHVMDRVGKMTSPKVSERVAFAPRATNIYVGGEKEEEGISGTDWSPKPYSSTQYGTPAYTAAIKNYNFDKEPQTLYLSSRNTYDRDFKPVVDGNVSDLKATGLVILLTDKNGQPVIASQKDNAKDVTNSQIFVRVQSGNDYYFQRLDNYNNLSSVFMKNPSKQLENEITNMNLKRAKILQNIKKLKAQGINDFEKFATVPQ